jgi:acetoacetyl-CoA synthetase
MRVPSAKRIGPPSTSVPRRASAKIRGAATASLGAIWSGCGQDYCPAAAAERLGQLEPAVLIAADGYRYGGREFDRRGAVTELAALLPGLRATIVFPRLGCPWPRRPGDSAGPVQRVRLSWRR